MKRLNAKNRIEKELENQLSLKSIDMTAEFKYLVGKEISSNIEATRTEIPFTPYVEYSTEFYVMQVPEFEDIIKSLRKIHSLTENYHVDEELTKITNILNDVK